MHLKNTSKERKTGLRKTLLSPLCLDSIQITVLERATKFSLGDNWKTSNFQILSFLGPDQVFHLAFIHFTKRVQTRNAQKNPLISFSAHSKSREELIKFILITFLTKVLCILRQFRPALEQIVLIKLEGIL